MIAFEAMPKAAGCVDRSVPIESTALLIPMLRQRFGITRVGDTTYLDRTGIPTYCAMVPKSRDLLGVYNGKGRTALAARVSAVMEAFERQAAATAELEAIPTAVSELDALLDLEQLELLNDVRALTVDCAMGIDLLTGQQIPVPHALIKFPTTEPRLFRRTNTNGLASGNNLTEAIYHAVTEMIERHVWSLYYIRNELVPRVFRGSDAAERCLGCELTFPTGNWVLDNLHVTIARSGLNVRVLMLEEGGFPHVALATVLEPASDPPMAHIGMGCSLSPAHAVERALTEAVQSRVVDIQAAREDLLRADDPVSSASQHGRRQKTLPQHHWCIDLQTDKKTLGEFKDEMSDDLTMDVDRLVRKVRDAGIRRLVAVDISPVDIPLAAVRMCAPDFETTAVDGRLGRIGLSEFNPLR